jgi:hypothetical protein
MLAVMQEPNGFGKMQRIDSSFAVIEVHGRDGDVALRVFRKR